MKAEDDERGRIPRRRRCRREDHEQNDVDQEHALAAHVVGDLPEDQRSEECSGDRGDGHQAFGGGIHVEVVRDQRQRHADDEEVEAVQQHAHRRQDPDLALGLGERGVVQMLLEGLQG